MLLMLLIMLYIVDVVVEPILNILPSLASQPRVVSPFSKWRSLFEYLYSSTRTDPKYLAFISLTPSWCESLQQAAIHVRLFMAINGQSLQKIRFGRIVCRSQSLKNGPELCRKISAEYTLGITNLPRKVIIYGSCLSSVRGIFRKALMKTKSMIKLTG